MSKPTNEAIKRTTAHANEHTAVLESTARKFARGAATTDELLEAAKKATNAWHAVGRARKGV